MIENSPESVTYRLHAIPTLSLRWNDQIVPSADLVFSLLFLSLFFFFADFYSLILLRGILEKFFEFFGDFSLSFFFLLDLSNFVYFFILAYKDSRGFFRIFLIFVELDLFDWRFSFSRWLFLIKIVVIFSNFSFLFNFLNWEWNYNLLFFSLFFCWFSYPSIDYSLFIKVF